MYSVFSLVNDPVIVTNGRLRILAINPAARVFLEVEPGWPGAGISWPDIISPLLEEGSEDLEDISSLLKGLTERHGAATLRIGGRRRLIRYKAALAPRGLPGGAKYVIVLTDRTPRAGEGGKPTVEKDWLATAIEHAGEAIVITDVDGIIQYVNPAFEKITGYSRDEAVGRNPRILKSGVHPPEFYEKMWKTITSGRTWSGELVNRRKDGALYHDQASIAPVKNEQGGIVSYVAVKRNISDRKRAEEALRVSEQRISAIINTVGEGIIVIGADSRIRFVNQELLEIFGYGERELAGRQVKTLMPEKYRAAHEAGMKRYLNGGAPIILGRRVELEGLRKDGTVFPLELRVQETKTPDGDRFFTAAIRDITGRKRMERELHEKAESLREMGAFKDKMLSIISHDLRSPLTSVIGLMELLLKPGSGELTERQRKILSTMKSSALHQLNLVENLAELSRIRRKKIKISPAPVRVADILKTSASILGQAARAKGVELVEEPGVEAWVEVDREKIIQVVNNLVSNSVKFTRRGGRITLSSRIHEGEVTIQISDTGVGIEPERLDRVFDITEGASTPGTDGERGTGLGLSICQEIILLHGGGFDIDSKPGEGTTARLTFKRAKKGGAP
ncbi:MAG: PAS domain S-box protein [Candidatus Nitrospinota bacterium M3_3B_026]